jgi:uncharacterized protein YkwD
MSRIVSDRSLAVILSLQLALTLLLSSGAPAQPRDPALEKARQEARSEDRAKRERGMRALVAAGEAGRMLLRPLLARQIDREIKQLRGFMKSGAGRKLRRLAATRLKEARKEALAAIYDRSVYPDENHGKVGQPIIDEKVGRVHALYYTPVDALRAKITSLDRLLRDLALTYRYAKQAGRVAVPKEFPDLKAAVAWLNRTADVQSVDASSTRSRREDDVKKALGQVEVEASPGEIKVVLLLNEYRRMMGRHPVSPHLELMRAARKHSQEMEDLGYFSHTSPTPEYRTPSMRAAREGYGGNCSENIARAGSPEGAHKGWYNSSGHHRNMLGRHRVIGLGRSKGGGFWTQMFGSGGLPGTEKAGGIKNWATYLRRAKVIPTHDLASHRDLAAWCRKHGLYRAMEREARLVLERRPDDEETRRLLGEVRDGERWLHPADQASRKLPSLPEKIKALAQQLKDRDPYVRMRTCRSLAALFDPGAEPWLIRALKDDHPDVRIEACLGLMTGIGQRVESVLKGRLKDKHPEVRHFAAAALYRRGNAVGIRGLLKDAVDGEPDVRASAGEALRFIGHQDFGYVWSAEKADRASAVARAVEWFKSQVDGLDIPK